MTGAVEQAYNAIRADIVSGRLGAGARVTAGPIAGRLGISRTPVREALRRLDAEGIVVLEANRGAHVKAAKWAEIEEIFNLRVLLEGYAAELGAQHLTLEAIERLATLNDEMRFLAKHKEGEYLLNIRERNAEFHKIIIEGSGNSRLSALIGTIVESHLILWTYQNYNQEDLARSMESHGELVDALRNRDGAWASSVMRSHLLGAKHVMIRNREAEKQKGKGLRSG